MPCARRHDHPGIAQNKQQSYIGTGSKDHPRHPTITLDLKILERDFEKKHSTSSELCYNIRVHALHHGAI